MTLKDTSLADMLGVIADNRKSPIDLAETLASHWAYDLYSRRPGPALLQDGVLKPTDLDLSCFLAALVDRKAVISLPVYRGRRPKTKRKNEHVMSSENRRGHIVGLTSNKDVFSFGVRIVDMGVVTTEGEEQKLGAYRNFMLVDLDGEWYRGWREVEFVPTAKENAWLSDKKLWTGNKIVFEHFVHPLRWTSFFGKYYLASKAMIARLEDESRALRKLVKEKAPPSEHKKYVYEMPEVGPKKSITVTAFEAVVDVPDARGKYRKPTSVKGAEKKLGDFRKVLASLRFATRATELAFHRHGPDSLPSWMKNQEWYEFKRPRSRTVWQRIDIPNVKDVALMYRTREKTEEVAA